MKAPKRNPLSKQVADILREQILSGRWGNKLPGYRPLCEELAVSQPTVKSALAILTSEGILLPAEPAKSRTIAPKAISKTSKKIKHLIVITPKPMEALHSVILSILRPIILEVQKRGWSSELIVTPAYKQSDPCSTLDKLKEEHSADSWLILSPERPMIEWADQSSLQILALGGDVQRSEIPSLGNSLSIMSIQAFSKLLSIGHRRIIMGTVGLKAGIAEATNKALQQCFRNYNSTFSSNYNIADFPRNNPQKFWEILENIFTLTPPTAIILPTCHYLATLLSFCNMRGIRIPEDLSVIVVANSSHLPWFRPQIAHFDTPTKQLSKQLIEWIINHPTQNRGYKDFELPYVPGKSVQPPSS